MNLQDGSIAPEEGVPVVDETPAPVGDEAPNVPPSEIAPDSSNTPKEDSNKAPENNAPKKSETPSNDAQKQFDEIISGWKEDRTLLEKSVKENRELKDQLQSYKHRLEKYESGEEEEGEDDTSLTPSQREQKIIERYEARKQEELKSQKDEVAREIGFLERTDPYFRENKQGILKVAADFNAQNLEQAIKIHRAQMLIASKNKAPVAQKAPTPPVTVRGYDPKQEEKMSFADLYRARGIN